MEKFKKFLKNPFYTIIIGLIGSIFHIIAFTIYQEKEINGLILLRIMLENLFYVALIIYFLCILLNLKNIKINMKIPQYLLLISIIVMCIIKILNYNDKFFGIVLCISYIGFFIYLLNIFNIKHFKFANNNFFINCIIINILSYIHLSYYFCYSLTQLSILLFLIFLMQISIVPYFYNYYNLIKEKNENGK